MKISVLPFKVSTILAVSAVGVACLSSAFPAQGADTPQSLMINPYPNAQTSTPAAPLSKVRQVSNADTGVDVNAALRRKVLVPSIEEPAYVSAPVSMPSVKDLPNLDMDNGVYVPVEERNVPAFSSRLGEFPSAREVASAPSLRQSSAQIDEVVVTLDDLKKAAANRPDWKRDEREFLPVEPIKVEAAPSDVRVDVPVSKAIPMPMPMSEITPAPVVRAVSSTPRYYSNAEELGVSLDGKGHVVSRAAAPDVRVMPAPISSVAPAPIAPAAKKVVISDRSAPEVPHLEMELIKPQMTPRFEDKPIAGLKEQDFVMPSQSALVSARPMPMPASMSASVRAPAPISAARVIVMEPIMDDTPERYVAATPDTFPVGFTPGNYSAPQADVLPAPLPLPGVNVSGQEHGYVRDVAAVPAIPPQEAGYSVYKADFDRMFSARREWKALQGFDLREILYHWSERAGVSLVWDTGEHFSTIKPLRVNSTYPEAVQELLGHYADSVRQPQGRIYSDPQTGERFLVIGSR